MLLERFSVPALMKLKRCLFMFLDKELSGMTAEWMSELAEYIRDNGKLVMKLDKAMYGLIKSAKL